MSAGGATPRAVIEAALVDIEPRCYAGTDRQRSEVRADAVIAALAAAGYALAQDGETVVLDAARWERVRSYAAAVQRMEGLIADCCDDREVYNAAAEAGQAAERALRAGDLDP